MSNFLSEAENLGQDFSNDGSQQSCGDQQTGNDVSQQAQGSSTGDSSSSGGGFLSNLEGQGKDTMVNQEVNGFMTKEGVPSGADGAIDKVVDGEANKFL